MTARRGFGREGRSVLHTVVSPFAVRSQVEPIARRLSALGWKVDVACPEGDEMVDLAPGVRHIPFEFHRSLTTPRHAASVLKLRRLIVGGGYDIVHVHGIIPGMLGRLAAIGSGVPVVYHCRGTYYEEGHALLSERLVRLAYPPLERLMGRVTSWTFTLNEEDTEDLVGKAGFSRDRVTCLGVGGSGIDLDVWNPERYGRAEGAAMREALGLSPDAKVVGFVGRLVRLKGVIELAEAVASLHQRGMKNVRLVFVGGVLESERDQATAGELRRLLRDREMEDLVLFTGHLIDPAPVMAAMDVLALPSYWESYGQVLVEAAALGAPVAAASSRGTRQAVVDGETGLLVPKRDSQALADALERILSDPSLAARMGAKGRERVVRELSLDRVVAKIVEAYETVLAEAGGNRDRMLRGSGDR